MHQVKWYTTPRVNEQRFHNNKLSVPLPNGDRFVEVIRAEEDPIPDMMSVIVISRREGHFHPEWY